MAIATVCSGGAAMAGPCGGTAAGTAIVASVRDGRTVMLADGREIRLAGIELAGRGPEALRRMVEGQSLRLETVGAGTDRYGRLTAYGWAENGPLLQEALLAAGEGLVSVRAGGKACTASLLAAEAASRTASRGLWADPNSALLRSDNLSRLDAARGRFALVEGKVLSVRESGAVIYMNFGRRWTRDFTVTLLKRQQRSFAAAGLDVKQLESRSVRVRGFIERRGGPIIEAAAPEQIEVID